MRLPESYYNRTSYAGTIIVVISLVLMFFTFVVSVFMSEGSNYVGLLLYMLFPGMLVFGLLLIPIGMWIRLRKIKSGRGSEISKGLIIDLNNTKHRNAVVIFILGTFVFLILSALGSYEAFHFSESNKFCGTLCHKVMEPEYTTYQSSAHARVKCVECHVGSGASWYVKSKMSGLYQVYSVLANKYPHPIPTPIESLRPARETCEQCHWPEKFYSNRVHNEIHYLADSSNTKWDITYRMKIGPSHSSQGSSEGIHWHINSNVEIEYITSSDDREFIPWVKYINKETGDTLIYEDTDNLLDDKAKQTAKTRTMDCMDCHNRPSHQFQTPQDFIDHAIAKGEISAELPEIKMVTMEIFNTTFATLDTANYTIKTTIENWYKENYPELYAEKSDLIASSIGGIQTAYSQNIFPVMGSNWDSYPNHKGHIEYNGCFRCHDDKHVTESGKTISKDCNLCHTILQQGTAEISSSVAFDQSMEFKHPVDVDEAWKEYLCTDCHRYLYQ